MLHTRIALIPAYEPDARLLALTRKLVRSGFSVVVVDDGSGPRYRALFAQLERDATVLSCQVNRGKGCALKTGFGYLERHAHADAVIVTLDSDGQHTAQDAYRVACCAASHPRALTLGVRDFGKGTPARSRLGNTVTRLVYRVSTGCRVSDTQTGLRAFGAPLLPYLSAIAGERYEYEMNMLLACPHDGVEIIETPIQTIYLDGNRSSHFHAIRDSLRVYSGILKFAASSLTGFAIDYGLYSVLTFALAGLGAAAIPVSNIAARIVSASANFAINRKLVFDSRGSTFKTGMQYALLAACILLGNTVLLSLAVNVLGIGRFAAKIFTELTFFALSWLAQRFWIFKGHKGMKQIL